MTDVKQSAVVEEEARLEGIGGWLIVPVLNLLLVILVGIFMVVKPLWTGEPLVAVVPIFAVAAALYSAVCLGALFEQMKIAKYLMIAFYGVALLSTLVATILLHAPADRTGVLRIAPYFRGALEIIMILYFVFSERVRRTLIH